MRVVRGVGNANISRGDGHDSLAGSELRSAHFAVRKAPYTIDADVALPATGQGTMRITVVPDPLASAFGLCVAIPMMARVPRWRAFRDGARSATVTVVSPAWLTVNVPEIVQDPEICRPLGHMRGRWWDRFGVTVGYGLVVGRGGVVAVGPSVSASVRVWP